MTSPVREWRVWRRRRDVPDDPQARVIRRQRGVIIVAIACAVLSTSALVLAQFIKSPQQAAAEAQPPEPSLITAPVTDQVLATSLIFRATVGPTDQLDLAPAVSSASEAEAAVISAVRVAAGDTVQPGQVLVEVSGRPVVVLRGQVPAYRDLRPGAAGPDVRQLQEALQALGFFHGTPTGTFGPVTKEAVTRFYDSIGYPVPDTGGPRGDGDRAELRAARDTVVAAQKAVDDMKQQIAQAGAPPAPAPSASPGGDNTAADLAAELVDLSDALDRAIEDEQDLIARTGPMVPAAEVAFVPTFPAQVLTVPATVGQTATGTVASIAARGLQVTAELDPADAGLLRTGSPARLDSELLGESAEATVTEVGSVTFPTQTDQNGETVTGLPYVPVTLTTDEPLPDAWSGTDTRVTVTLAQTDEAVLAVPIAAVTTRADGRSVVTVVEPGGVTRQVVVRAGVSADGLVEVSPADGVLAAGDLVSVGTGSPAT